jgi:hypothetical protein
MTTGKKTASQAGKDLRDPKTPKKDRGPIASDLAQAARKPKSKKRKWAMTTTGAISNANSARSATDTNQKLNYIAQAISELARAVAVIEQDVKHIKRQTSA